MTGMEWVFLVLSLVIFTEAIIIYVQARKKTKTLEKVLSLLRKAKAMDEALIAQLNNKLSELNQEKLLLESINHRLRDEMAKQKKDASNLRG